MTEEKTKGLMTNTLKELEKIDIQALSIVTIGEIKLNLTNDQVIKLVNFNAGRIVLTWDSTFEEMMTLGTPFLT